jgi:predicted RNA-binding Zn-ribbon protein involved in translation (DUF1610 family)
MATENSNKDLLRRIIISLLILVAIVIDRHCRNNHFCICGHLQHGPYPWWVHTADLMSMIFFIAAGVFCLNSRMRLRHLLFALLMMMGAIRFDLENDSFHLIPVRLQYSVPLGFDSWLLVMIAAITLMGLFIPGKTKYIKGLCATCGYNLTGNVSGTCPECGEKIELASLNKKDHICTGSGEQQLR